MAVRTLCIGITIALTLFACAPKESGDTGGPAGNRGSTPSTTDTTTDTTLTTTTDTAAQQAKVEVTLTEHRIQMPSTLPAGLTQFSVTNSGKEPHNFEISGQGQENEFATLLQPGETRSMMVDLKPGTFKIYCPITGDTGAHEQKGMTLQLTVSPK